MKLGRKKKPFLTYCSYSLSRCMTLVSLVTVSFFSFNSAVYAQDVIANSSSENIISANTLRQIYSMRLQTWRDGSGITVFVLNPAGERHRKFSLEILNVFPYQLQRAWDVLVFSGTGRSPVVVESEQEMISRVKSTPGSIGYIIDSEVPLDVKKVSIQ